MPPQLALHATCGAHAPFRNWTRGRGSFRVSCLSELLHFPLASDESECGRLRAGFSRGMTVCVTKALALRLRGAVGAYS